MVLDIMKLKDKLHIRSQIQKDINRFFNKKIKISERAFQVLEHSSNPKSPPNARHILSAAISLYPSLAEKIEDAGINLRKGMLPDISLIDSIETKGWGLSMKSCFVFNEKSYAVCSSAYRIISSKSLKVEDLVLGPIETEGIGERFSDITRHTLWFMNQYDIEQDMVEIDSHRQFFSPEYQNEVTSFYGKLSKKLRSTLVIDPDAGSQQFILEYDGDKHRFRPFGVWGAYQLAESPLKDGELWIARANVIEPYNIYTEEAIDELEFLINKKAKEIEFQRFFENHPEFLLSFGNYAKIHPQIVLTEDGGTKLIPDFFLEKLNSNFCDILDIKRSFVPLVRYQKNRLRFRDQVMASIAQVKYYHEWFENKNNRKIFNERYKLDAYKPRCILVIGRNNSFFSEEDRNYLEHDLPAYISLKTYDDVVEKARQWKKLASTLRAPNA